MEYKDEEGNILHGFSAHDLTALIAENRKLRGDLNEENQKLLEENKKMRYIQTGFLLLLGLVILIILYILEYIIHNHVITNIVNRCI